MSLKYYESPSGGLHHDRTIEINKTAKQYKDCSEGDHHTMIDFFNGATWADGNPRDNWVPVDYFLPRKKEGDDFSDRVFVCVNWFGFATDRYNHKEGKWERYSNVTHWQPFLAPPKMKSWTSEGLRKRYESVCASKWYTAHYGEENAPERMIEADTPNFFGTSRLKAGDIVCSRHGAHDVIVCKVYLSEDGIFSYDLLAPDGYLINYVDNNEDCPWELQKDD